MSEREAGWYWVKTPNEWECARWDTDAWFLGDMTFDFDDEYFNEIGPRIPTPDEPWQCVPVEPTDDMMHAGCNALGDCERLGECHLDCNCSPAPKVYTAMLAAAPNPGGE